MTESASLGRNRSHKHGDATTVVRAGPANCETGRCHDGDMTTTDRRLAAIATGQHGIIHRREAHASGVTDRQLRSRVKSGSLVQTGPHSFRLFGAHSTPIYELRALLVDLGPEAFASGPTAAALHGFDGFDVRAPFNVTVVRGRNLRRIGHRIHTATELDLVDRSVEQDCPTLSGARTIIDLARTLDEAQLTAALDSGLRDGIYNESLLHRRIVALRRSGRYGIPKLIQVIEGIEVTAGGHSWLEREFLRLAAEAGLPAPRTQQVLSRANDRIVRVDFAFPGTNVVVEVLGYRYHRSTAAMSRDAERYNALLRAGLLPFQYTYEQIVARPAAVVDELRPMLRAA